MSARAIQISGNAPRLEFAPHTPSSVVGQHMRFSRLSLSVQTVGICAIVNCGRSSRNTAVAAKIAEGSKIPQLMFMMHG